MDVGSKMSEISYVATESAALDATKVSRKPFKVVQFDSDDR